MIKKLLFVTMITTCLLSSCKKKFVDDFVIQVYKFEDNKDYSLYVPVGLSEDKTKITSAPGTSSRWPIKLFANYYLNGSMGVNSGYLSITKEEYNLFEIKPSVDSMYSYIVDVDPYSEFYLSIDGDIFKNENSIYGIDTALINSLIRLDELEKYFVRLK